MKAILFFLLFGISQTAAQTLSFRTDGYYLYDNGQDNLFLIRTDNKAGNDFMEFFNSVSPLGEKPAHWAKAPPCLPANTVATVKENKVVYFLKRLVTIQEETVDEKPFSEF